MTEHDHDEQKQGLGSIYNLIMFANIFQRLEKTTHDLVQPRLVIKPARTALAHVLSLLNAKVTIDVVDCFTTTQIDTNIRSEFSHSNVQEVLLAASAF